MVKRFLSLKGKEYKEVNLDDDQELRQQLMNKTGVMTVPITQIGDEYIIGWNPSKLGALI